MALDLASRSRWSRSVALSAFLCGVRREGPGEGQAALPSARRYSSKFSLVSIFQYPVKSTGMSGSDWGHAGTESLGCAGTAAADAIRSGWWAARKCASSGDRGALWGGDSWIPGSAHKARGRIHCSRRPSPLGGAGAGREVCP